MELFPAIDLRGGRVVRLTKGDYSAETSYGDDPVAQAQAFAGAGARWIHTVDLDAARTGEATNLAVIARICDGVRPGGVRVQAGGGVRSLAAAAALFDAGVERVVVGTAAIERPELLDELGTVWSGRVVVGLDARGSQVAVRGWTEDAGLDVADVASRLRSPQVAAIVATQIEVDGTMAGPDLGLYERLLAATDVDVIASGGVSTLADLGALESVRVRDRSVAGVIVGKALYEGRFELEEAIRTCTPSV